MNDIKKASKSVKIWGWVVLIAGILALASPLVSGITIAIMVGALMMIAGITRLFDAFQGGGVWSGLLGIISAIAGLVMLIHPVLGLASMTMVLIVYFMVLGVSEIVGAFKLRPAPGWGFLLFSGLVSVLLSYMISNQWPLSGAWAVGVLVGVQLIFSGITMITLGSAVKQLASE